MGRSGRYRLQHSQNFLRKPALAEQLVAKSGIGGEDVVIEIGAGTGALTDALARRATQVIAIEHDTELAWRVGERFQGVKNVCVFPFDALQFPLPTTPFKVFANVPFRHTSAIIGKLTTGSAPPVDIWLIVQKEAAERYLPGDSMTMVALSLAPWFIVSIEHRFERQDFRPTPRVDSVMLRMRRRDRSLVDFQYRERFTHFIEAAFSAWQPTLAQALDTCLPRRAAAVLATKGFCLGKRPSQVDLETWLGVFDVLAIRDDHRVWDTLRRASERLRSQQSSLDRPTRTPLTHGKGRPR
ncbi:MAG TPA: rRNA adenine dimethyltransferase family protein [Thermomicrobiales bacterium]|nr:rRNA adenine dimethyltransferase family protein [Thermomicrobiales bacterium]